MLLSIQGSALCLKIFGRALLKSLLLCLSILLLGCLVTLFQGEVAWLLMLMKCNVHPHKCDGNM